MSILYSQYMTVNCRCEVEIKGGFKIELRMTVLSTLRHSNMYILRTAFCTLLIDLISMYISITVMNNRFVNAENSRY